MKKIELNTKGLEMIEYKKEYNKNSNSAVVKKAIETAVSGEFTELQLKIFKEATEKEFRDNLLTMKKFQKSDEDYFNEKVNKIRETFDKLGVDYVLVEDKENLEVAIRRKFGMSIKDIPEYFGVSDEKEMYKMAQGGFLYTFVNTRIRKVLEDIVEDIQSENKGSLPVKISQAYRHEKFKSLFNINVDIIMSYKEGMNKIAVAKHLLEELVEKYNI